MITIFSLLKVLVPKYPKANCLKNITSSVAILLSGENNFYSTISNQVWKYIYGQYLFDELWY